MLWFLSEYALRTMGIHTFIFFFYIYYSNVMRTEAASPAWLCTAMHVAVLLSEGCVQAALYG